MFRPFFPALLANRLFRGGASIVALFALLALTAPLLTQAHLLGDPLQQDPRGLDEDGMPRSPLHAHALGTDNLGRDLLARVVHGARVSLTIGVAAMLTATVLGVTVGLLAGFYGGRLDLGLMRFTEMNMTIPAVLLAVALAGLIDGKQTFHLPLPGLEWHALDLQLKRGMVSLFLVIGFVCWPGMVRVIRAQVLSLKEREFVQAARALGASDARLILRHVLPNMLTGVGLAAYRTCGEVVGDRLLAEGERARDLAVGPALGDQAQDLDLAGAQAVRPAAAPSAARRRQIAEYALGQGLQEVFDPPRGR